MDDIDRNGIVTTYEVLYQSQESFDNEPRHQNTSDLTISLTDLHEYSNYSIQVKAYTDIGPGNNSMQMFATTLEAGKFILLCSAVC